MTKETIIVGGMSCEHCKTAVENAVKSLRGVSKAEVDLAAGELTVEYDETKTSHLDIEETIVEEGFTIG